jgi:uncharacterized GH25 family protein
MGARRLPLLLIPLLVLGLMAAALILALDGSSPTALLPGGDEPVVETADGGGLDDASAGIGGPGSGGRTRRPGRITGDVRDLRSREPAPGRTVVLTLESGDIRQIVTDAQGAFAFSDVPAEQRHELRVDGDDHAPIVRPGLTLRGGQRLDVGTLWLADGVRVAFEVRSFDGRPLAGATVRAFAQGAGNPAFDTPQDPTPVAVAHTDGEGVAHFAGLPPGTWTFTAERGGYARRGLVGATVRDGVQEERFELALERGYRLHGRVLDALGRPVSGAPVLAIRRTLVSDETTAPLALRTTTDRDGAFVFGALPAADVVLWSGWPRGRLAVLAAVRLPGVESLDLVLLRGGRLEGRVTRAEDGEPVADAQVFVTLQVLGSFVLSFELETYRDGRYGIDLPMPGSVTGVSAESRGYRTRWAELADGEIAVPTGALVTHDLVLERGGLITGRVLGPDGPLAGVQIGATNPSWWFETTSDRTGRFELNGLPPERFLVMGTLWGWTLPGLPNDPDGSLQDGSAPVELVVDLGSVAEAEVELRMQPGGMLHGHVETHDGTPAAGALVTLPWGQLGTHAADDGSFTLGPLATEELQIDAVAADGGARGSVTVSVPPPPEQAAAVVIRLGPALRVSGRLSSATGAALEGAYVQFVPWDSVLDDPVQDEWSWLEAPRRPVRADGTFDHAVDGSMGPFVVRAGALGHRRALSGRVSVSAGQPEVLVELELERGATFTGRVVDLDGAPVPGAYVAAVAVPPGADPYQVGYPGAWGPPIVAVADQHGVFRVDGLDSGPHAVRTWAEGYLPDAHVVNVPEDSGHTFEVVAALSIQGRITFTDGAPVAGVRVAALKEDGGGYAEGRSDADGRFLILGLSAGTYRLDVQASADGRQNMVARVVDGIAAGSSDVHVRVERGRIVSGHVTDASGNAVVGAQVQASRDEDALSSTHTDSNGAFSVGGLPSGRVTIVVTADAMDGVGAVVRTVPSGTEGLDVRLPAPAVLEGVLVGADGAAITQQELQLHPVDEAVTDGVSPWWRNVSTEGDGSFSLTLAPGATYRVTLSNHPSLTLPAETRVRAGGGSVRLVAGRGESISGRIVDGNAKPVAGVMMRATRGDANRYAAANERGEFTITGLHRGVTYTLDTSDGQWDAVDAPTVEAPAGGVTISLRRLRPLAGKVVDTAGDPIGSVAIEAVADDGSTWTTWTDDDGRFALNGLPEGDYDIRVDRIGNGEFVDCGTARAGVIGNTVRYPGR